ncbi:SPI-4 type I secretion system auxiliary protein SiiA [Salmonella enterica]
MEDESNPWPSFVDTFSTVLCIFIFLMLVFALNNMIIMYDNSIKVYKANIENKTKSTAQNNNGANDNSNANEIVNKEVNTQDVSDGMTTMSGKEVGVYDIADGQKTDITSTKNELVITYHGRLRSFSEEDTYKIKAWLEDKINSNLLIEMVIPQADISFSDSLRLGYERGIILMKEIKKIYPDVVIDMSVNSAASSTTSKAIITTINKKVSE